MKHIRSITEHYILSDKKEKLLGLMSAQNSDFADPSFIELIKRIDIFKNDTNVDIELIDSEDASEYYLSMKNLDWNEILYQMTGQDLLIRVAGSNVLFVEGMVKVAATTGATVYNYVFTADLETVLSQGLKAGSKLRMSIKNAVYGINVKSPRLAKKALEGIGMDLSNRTLIKIDASHYKWYIDPAYELPEYVLTVGTISPKHIEVVDLSNIQPQNRAA